MRRLVWPSPLDLTACRKPSAYQMYTARSLAKQRSGNSFLRGIVLTLLPRHAGQRFVVSCSGLRDSMTIIRAMNCITTQRRS